jgi:hypothetical protein
VYSKDHKGSDQRFEIKIYEIRNDCSSGVCPCFALKIKIDMDNYFELTPISITEKSSSVRSKTIPKLLLRGNVEANPGPNNKKVKPNITLRNFNCKGLGDINKFRRVLSKLRKEVQLWGKAMLQETHIIE